jgi:hypothetical protein
MGIKTREMLDGGTWLVWCPACDIPHEFRGWTFDGNHEAPTFTPSMKVTTMAYDGSRELSRCHSHLIAGVWEYLGDCTHGLAGQKAIAPDWPRPIYGGTKPPRDAP